MIDRLFTPRSVRRKRKDALRPILIARHWSVITHADDDDAAAAQCANSSPVTLARHEQQEKRSPFSFEVDESAALALAGRDAYAHAHLFVYWADVKMNTKVSILPSIFFLSFSSSANIIRRAAAAAASPFLRRTPPVGHVRSR